jgi:hypothetical protein
MAMNQWVAEMFGTAGAGQDGDSGQAKTAQLELFAKLAADEGIDLTTLSPEQVNDLYASTFGKTAAEGEEEEEEGPEHEAAETPEKEKGEKEEGDNDEKEAAARAEHEEKKAQVAKLAEAELMGQVMAHSLVRELNEIEKAASMPAALAKGLKKGAAGSEKKASAQPKAAVKQASGAKSLGLKVPQRQPVKKEASAFDTLAAQNAIKLASAAGYDADQAYQLINSVYTLGLDESEKVAFIEDTNEAIHVRSLEYLERAGYPVNWEEVFGG